MRLGRVFDEIEAVPRAEFRDGPYVAQTTVEVDPDHRASAFADHVFQFNSAKEKLVGFCVVI